MVAVLPHLDLETVHINVAGVANLFVDEQFTFKIRGDGKLADYDLKPLASCRWRQRNKIFLLGSCVIEQGRISDSTTFRRARLNPLPDKFRLPHRQQRKSK